MSPFCHSCHSSRSPSARRRRSRSVKLDAGRRHARPRRRLRGIVVRGRRSGSGGRHRRPRWCGRSGRPGHARRRDHRREQRLLAPREGWRASAGGRSGCGAVGRVRHGRLRRVGGRGRRRRRTAADRRGVGLDPPPAADGCIAGGVLRTASRRRDVHDCLNEESGTGEPVTNAGAAAPRGVAAPAPSLPLRRSELLRQQRSDARHDDEGHAACRFSDARHACLPGVGAAVLARLPQCRRNVAVGGPGDDALQRSRLLSYEHKRRMNWSREGVT